MRDLASSVVEVVDSQDTAVVAVVEAADTHLACTHHRDFDHDSGLAGIVLVLAVEAEDGEVVVAVDSDHSSLHSTVLVEAAYRIHHAHTSVVADMLRKAA